MFELIHQSFAFITSLFIGKMRGILVTTLQVLSIDNIPDIAFNTMFSLTINEASHPI